MHNRTACQPSLELLEDLAQAGKEDYFVELIALVLCLQSCLHWPHKDLPSLSRSICAKSTKSRASRKSDALLFLGLGLGFSPCIGLLSHRT